MQKERMAQDPYFTSAELSSDELTMLISHYHVETEPSFDEELNKDDWPDFSCFELKPGDVTYESVFFLNYLLFTHSEDKDADAIKSAEDMGFSKEKPITVDWVISHPREANAIMNGVYGQGEIFCSKRDVLQWAESAGYDSQNPANQHDTQ